MIFIFDIVEERQAQPGLEFPRQHHFHIHILFFTPQTPPWNNKFPTFFGEGALSLGYANFWSSSKWQSYMLFSRWLKLENVKA